MIISLIHTLHSSLYHAFKFSQTAVSSSIFWYRFPMADIHLPLGSWIVLGLSCQLPSGTAQKDWTSAVLCLTYSPTHSSQITVLIITPRHERDRKHCSSVAVYGLMSSCLLHGHCIATTLHATIFTFRTVTTMHRWKQDMRRNFYIPQNCLIACCPNWTLRLSIAKNLCG